MTSAAMVAEVGISDRREYLDQMAVFSEHFGLCLSEASALMSKTML